MKTIEVKTTTYQKVIEASGLMKYIDTAPTDRTLKANEYFALMVTDNENKYTSPHVKGIDVYTHEALVGLERTTRENNDEGVYISKEYRKRKSFHRGRTVIVEVNKKDLSKFCIL